MTQNSPECRRLSYYSYYHQQPELPELDLTNSSYTEAEGDETTNSNSNSHDGDDDDSDELMRVASPTCYKHQYRINYQQQHLLESLSPISKSPWTEDDQAPARFIYTSSNSDCLPSTRRRVSCLSSSIISSVSTSNATANHRSPSSKLRYACGAGVVLWLLIYAWNVIPHLRRSGNAFVHVRVWKYHVGFFTSVWKEEHVSTTTTSSSSSSNTSRNRWLPVQVSFHEDEDGMWHHLEGEEDEGEEEYGDDDHEADFHHKHGGYEEKMRSSYGYDRESGGSDEDYEEEEDYIYVVDESDEL